MSSDTQPLVLALASQALVEGVHAATAQAVREWQGAWPLAAVVEDVAPADDENVTALHAIPWLERRPDAGVRLWWPAAVEPALGRAMFGPGGASCGEDGTAARCARAAAQALRDALARAWQVAAWEASDDTAVSPLSRWHAPVRVRLAVEGVAIAACVPAQRFAPAAARRASRTPLKGAPALAAIAGLPAGLEVVVGHAELSVADIAGLQCGDVVPLDAFLDQPLPVAVAGQPPALHARLGHHGARRAIQFVSRSPS